MGDFAQYGEARITSKYLQSLVRTMFQSYVLRIFQLQYTQKAERHPASAGCRAYFRRQDISRRSDGTSVVGSAPTSRPLARDKRRLSSCIQIHLSDLFDLFNL